MCSQASGKAAKASKQDAPSQPKGKPGKKGKEGPSFGLGKGTCLIRSLIDSTSPRWASDSNQAAANGTSSETLSQVVQLAQQLQSSGEEDAGQASVPETLGEPTGTVDRRTVIQLQQALQVCSLQSACMFPRLLLGTEALVVLPTGIDHYSEFFLSMCVPACCAPRCDDKAAFALQVECRV